MIRKNQSVFNAVQKMLDILCTVICFYTTCYLLRTYYEGDWGFLADFGLRVMYLVFIGILYFFLYKWSNLYVSYRKSRFRLQTVKVLQANIIAFVILNLLFFSFHFEQLFFLFCLLNTLVTLLYRLILRKALHYFRQHGYNKKYILCIGCNRSTEKFLHRMKKNSSMGYEVLGYLGNPNPAIEQKIFRLGNYDDASDYVKNHLIDEVVIMLNERSSHYLGYWTDFCDGWGIKFSILPDYFADLSVPLTVDTFEGIPMLNTMPLPLDDPWNAAVKRIFDILGSLFCILLFSPVLLITAAAIKLTSKGPVIFKQTRVSLNRKEFTMYKFRSMQVEQHPKYKMAEKNDVRVTSVGKFIRKYSIDELPQLFNVLKGDMSLIGPRPEIPYFVDQFRHEIPQYMKKHTSKSGMTGWAQVNGLRGGDTSISERISYDLYYIQHWSLWFDIKILFLTAVKGIFNSGAY